jgi:hypothetical protein
MIPTNEDRLRRRLTTARRPASAVDPDQRPGTSGKGVPVDTIEALLGNLLLVLAGLALVLLAIILLLVQANAIVWLAGRLTQRLRSDDRDGTEHHPPIHDRPHARSASKDGGE